LDRSFKRPAEPRIGQVRRFRRGKKSSKRAAQGEFRQLINAAIFTGARYGELVRLRVGDFNGDVGVIYVGQSKSGKARHVVLTDEGQRFFAQITAGRPTDELMLRHVDGSAWGTAHQTRPMREACAAAHIKPAGFHVLRHTSASLYVMAGISLQIVAKNLGHADTRMTEKHYAHLAPSYVAEQIRSRAPTFGTVEPSAIVPIISSIARG
jgi:integrase